MGEHALRMFNSKVFRRMLDSKKGEYYIMTHFAIYTNHLVLLEQQNNRTGWSSGNALVLYSGGASFESGHGHVNTD
jgi:hypothetical protein